jgi:uncharacterized protein (TIGR00645 family)
MAKESSKTLIKNASEQSLLERIFERALWSTRFIVIIAVIFGVISSITMFLIGSYEIIHGIIENNPITNPHANHENIIIIVIGAVDLYLIGVILLIFSFGIYELFISKIDIARIDKDHSILEIYSLDELKSKIIKVIIMVLVVSFFQRVLSMRFETALDMIYLAASILAISLGVYFLNKNKK